jgi:hypothetical protein
MISPQKSVAKTRDRPSRIGGETGEQSTRRAPLDPLLELQKTIGNQAAVQLLRSGTIQTKLGINLPGDMYEQKADRVAEKIVSSSSPLLIQRKCACGGTPGPTGECDECSKKNRLGLQTKLRINESGDIYEKEADRIADQVLATPVGHSFGSPRPHIQRFSQSTGQIQMNVVPPSVDQALASPGKPLEAPLRRDVEHRFGHDFSHVRVHTGDMADRSARDITAHAYTSGHDIVFAHGQYEPSQRSGRRLIAHELAHVLQQSGSSGPRRTVQRKARVKGCGMLNLAASITDIGSAAHVQIQGFLGAKGITPEFSIPRATKLDLGFGCRKLGTPLGFADLARKGVAGYDIAEIKPISFGGRARAKLEVGHYRRRARQSLQRLFKFGTCGRRPAGPDDVGFKITTGAAPLTGFSLLSGVLAGDVTIGPFSGDPSLTLKAKEVSPGAICYWCTKGQNQQQQPAKPPGPNVGLGVSIGGSSSGAYNAGVGVSIMSDSTAYGTAGAGISYKSDTKAAGAAGAGASIESDSMAAGAAGVGATKDTQSVGAGVAGAGASEGSVSAAAGAAGAGTSQDSATAGAGVAASGSVKDSAVAGAGTIGSGKIEGSQGAGTGSPGKPVDAKDQEQAGKPGDPKAQPAGKATEPKAKDTEGKPGEQTSGTPSTTPKQSTAGGQQPGEGTTDKQSTAQTGEAKAAAGTEEGKSAGDKGGADKGAVKGGGAAGGAKGTGSESAAAKGAQGAKETGPDPGSTAGGDTAATGQPGTAGTSGKDTAAGSTTKVPGGLGVAPVVGFPATEADRQKAADETAKVALLLSKASAAQIALFRRLAQQSPDGRYVVPASQWVDTMMKATEGLSEEDIKYLQTLNWTPANITPEELRKKILETLKTKKPPATGDASKAGGDEKSKKDAAAGDGAGAGTSAKKGAKGRESATGDKGTEKGPALSGFEKGEKYEGDITNLDYGFQIQPDKRITPNTKKGAKFTLEVRWREGEAIKRARVEYEVIGDPIVDTDPNSEKQMWRIDLRSTNTQPLALTPKDVPTRTVLPARASAVYYIPKKK